MFLRHFWTFSSVLNGSQKLSGIPMCSKLFSDVLRQSEALSAVSNGS